MLKNLHLLGEVNSRNWPIKGLHAVVVSSLSQYDTQCHLKQVMLEECTQRVYNTISGNDAISQDNIFKSANANFLSELKRMECLEKKKNQKISIITVLLWLSFRPIMLKQS